MQVYAKKIGLYFAAIHLLAFSVTVLHIHLSPDPQSPLLWVFFAAIDFPISLIYLLAGKFHANTTNLQDNLFLAQVLYVPHLIHGVLGTIWWYFLPRLILTKKYGGIWGKP